jgi:predicted DNA-binding transcriptional regulator YafY
LIYTEPNFALPTMFLSEGDMLAVFIGIEVAERYAGTPYESMLKNSLDKIARSFPETVSLQLNQFASFAMPPSLTVDEIKLNQLYTAIRHLHPVTMTYFTASNGKTTQRQVDPYHLHHYNGEWYLLALDSKHQEIRTFNVGRIRELHPLEHQLFRRPPNFNAQKWLENSFGIEADTTIHQVRIRFDAAQAHYIRERQWHSRQSIENLPDGSLILQFPASGLGEVMRWVLKYGCHAQVLQPPLLQKMVKNEVAAMNKLYAGQSRKKG